MITNNNKKGYILNTFECLFDELQNHLALDGVQN